MAAQTPTTEPASLIAGDTAKWLKSLPDYLASDSWVLTYTLVNATTRITFSAGASGDDHLVNVAASTTTGWTAGTYDWRSQVAKSGEVFTVGTGSIKVEPSFAAAVDARSHARKTLTNIEAYLEDSNNLKSAMYEIAGRRLQHIPLPELLALRDRYRFDVAKEDAAAASARGLPDKRRVFVRFGA